MKRKLLCSLLAAFGLSVAAATHAEISDGVVKLGVLSDMSGPYSDANGPGSVVAARMAVQDFFDSSKSKSKLKVEVVSADHQNKADVGSALVRKWYDTEGVDAVFDVPTSSVALAVTEITKDKGKAFINSGAGSADLTGKACSPNTVHWLYDTWMLGHSSGNAVVETGGDTWFFLTADYAFGHALENETSNVVKAAGGEVKGSVRVPLGTHDFSSFLLQAQTSGAKIIGLANAGADTVNSVKQAAEFGITQAGQKLVGLLMQFSDVRSLGLQTAQGLFVTEAFYWDLNDDTRAWSKRFAQNHDGKYPTMFHAGVYASVLHYLKAVDALQSDDGTKVVAKMKEIPTDDPLFGRGEIRIDGRKTHPVYLFEVKSPSDSKYDFDYYNKVATTPAEKAFRPLNEGGCYLVERQKS